MSNRRIIAFNTISQVIGKVFTSGTTFILSMLLARTLGASGYGDFTKITTFVAFFYLFADFGLNTAYLELSDNDKTQNNLLALRVIIGIFLMFLSVSILAFLPGTSVQGYTPMVKLGIILFSISILFQSLITTANAFFQKNLRYELAAYALVAGSFSSLLFVGVLISTHLMSVLSVILAFLSGSLVSALSSLFLSRKMGMKLIFSFDTSLVKKMLTIAFPLGLTLICNVVYFHADSVILALFRSTEEVGIYGFAYKFFELPLVVPTFFMNAVYPLLLLSKKNEDMQAFIHQVKQSALVLSVLSFILILFGYFVSPLIAFVKNDFQSSIEPFRILLLSLPVFYLTSVTMWVLIALKKRVQLLLIYLFSMIMNIGLNVFLIPIYGYMAAAWITVVSETLVLFLSFLIIQRYFNSNS